MGDLLQRAWYRKTHPLALLLTPLGWLFCALVWLRRRAYAHGLLQGERAPVPVLVVGNISVGGTGKTPFVIWLVDHLCREGWRPGIIIRGYGGGARRWPQQVRHDSDPVTVGDEAVLLARRSGRPVAAGPDRLAAARALVSHRQCDIVVSDDGLQHYRLARDVEFAVVDGTRRLGNGRCLPAGPLRDPPGRLGEVDVVVAYGQPARGEFAMSYRPEPIRRIRDDNITRAPSPHRGVRVHGVAGIGDPERFFRMLSHLGFRVVPHAFPDHHAFVPGDLRFAPDLPVIMTEKDAVKCRHFAGDHMWYLPITAEPSPLLAKRLSLLLEDLRRG